MPFYRFECEKCEVFWEKKGSMDKPPKTSKCSICNKRRDRVFTSPSLHFKGMDFYTNQAKAEKFKRDGMDKDTANAVMLTVAPTGTISMVHGVSSGVEPIFSAMYKSDRS